MLMHDTLSRIFYDTDFTKEEMDERINALNEKYRNGHVTLEDYFESIDFPVEFRAYGVCKSKLFGFIPNENKFTGVYVPLKGDEDIMVYVTCTP